MLNRFLIATFALLSQAASAWDDPAAVVMPTLEGLAPSSVSLAAISVTVSGRDVAVLYSLRNRADSTQSFDIGSYFPPFGRLGLLDDYPDRAFSEQSVALNGKVLKTRQTAVYLLQGRNVSSRLLALKIDGQQALLKDHPEKLWSPRTARQLKLLGLLDVNGGSPWPLWQAVVSKSWQIVMPGQSGASLEIRYRARPAVTNVDAQSADFSRLLAQHCLAPEQLLTLSARDGTASLPESLQLQEYSVPLRLGAFEPLDALIDLPLATFSSPHWKAIAVAGCRLESPPAENGRFRTSGAHLDFLTVSVPAGS